MAPLGKAINVCYDGPPNADTKVYHGEIDPEWAVGQYVDVSYQNPVLKCPPVSQTEVKSMPCSSEPG
jgi:hypothetical protein